MPSAPQRSGFKGIPILRYMAYVGVVLVSSNCSQWPRRILDVTGSARLASTKESFCNRPVPPSGQWQVTAQATPQAAVGMHVQVQCTPQLWISLGLRIGAQPQLLWDYRMGLPRRFVPVQPRLQDTYVRHQTTRSTLQLGHINRGVGDGLLFGRTRWQRTAATQQRDASRWPYDRPQAPLWGLHWLRHHDLVGPAWQWTTGFIAAAACQPLPANTLAYRGDLWQPIHPCKQQNDCSVGYFCGPVGVCLSQQVASGLQSRPARGRDRNVHLERNGHLDRSAYLDAPEVLGVQVAGLTVAGHSATDPGWGAGGTLLVMHTRLHVLGPGRPVLVRQPAAVKKGLGQLFASMWLTWGTQDAALGPGLGLGLEQGSGPEPGPGLGGGVASGSGQGLGLRLGSGSRRGLGLISAMNLATAGRHRGAIEAAADGYGLWALAGYAIGPIGFGWSYHSGLRLRAVGFCSALATPKCMEPQPWGRVGPGRGTLSLHYKTGPVAVKGTTSVERRRTGVLMAQGGLGGMYVVGKSWAFLWHGSVTLPLHLYDLYTAKQRRAPQSGSLGWVQMTPWPALRPVVSVRMTASTKGSETPSWRLALRLQAHRQSWGVSAFGSVVLPTAVLNTQDTVCLKPRLHVETWVAAQKVRCRLVGTAMASHKSSRAGGFVELGWGILTHMQLSCGASF